MAWHETTPFTIESELVIVVVKLGQKSFKSKHDYECWCLRESTQMIGTNRACRNYIYKVIIRRCIDIEEFVTWKVNLAVLTWASTVVYCSLQAKQFVQTKANFASKIRAATFWISYQRLIEFEQITRRNDYACFRLHNEWRLLTKLARNWTMPSNSLLSALLPHYDSGLRTAAFFHHKYVYVLVYSMHTKGVSKYHLGFSVLRWCLGFWSAIAQKQSRWKQYIFS